MTTKNEITGDDIISKINNDKYRDGFAAAFNKPKCDRCGKTLLSESTHTCTPKDSK